MIDKTTIYISRAQVIHNNKYDYSLVKNIKSNKQKIDIICSVHGVFSQAVSSHINAKQGCPRCNGNYRKSTDEVLEEIRLVHGNKFTYSPFKYRNNKQKIKINCSVHGEFSQAIKEHIKGSGCPKCARNAKMDTATFIEKANKKHKNKYDYSCTDYVRTDEVVLIRCYKHGEFQQTPHAHLAGYGCTKCVSNSSKKENEWLDSLGISTIKRQQRLKLGDKIRVVDGFDPVTNTVYEFYGDYFHGNEMYYDHGWTNRLNGQTFAELYKKTKEKEALIKAAGYNLMAIWESEFISLKGKPFYRKTVNPIESRKHVMGYINMWKWAYPVDDEAFGCDAPDQYELLKRCSKTV